MEKASSVYTGPGGQGPIAPEVVEASWKERAERAESRVKQFRKTVAAMVEGWSHDKGKLERLARYLDTYGTSKRSAEMRAIITEGEDA